MLNFFFKKNFYDSWDNLFLIIIPNLILDFCILLGLGIMFLGREHIFIWIAVFLLLLITVSVMSLAWSQAALEIAEGNICRINLFLKKIPNCIFDGIRYGIVLFLFFITTASGIIYYFKNNNVTFVGFTAGITFCWVSLAILMSLSWYPALRTLMNNSFLKSIKKCFILFVDNFRISMIISLYNLFLTFITVIMLGLFPGFAGISLSRVNALRLLLKKYDYLDELDKNNEPIKSKKRKKIPWETLLKEEIEAVGSRTFKSFFMTWKE